MILQDLMKLANFFQVSLFYLLTGEKTDKEIAGEEFVPYDFDLMEKYLPESVREIIAKQRGDIPRIADEIGFTRQAIDNVMNRKAPLSIHMFLALIKKTQVPFDELLRVKPSMRRLFGNIFEQFSKEEKFEEIEHDVVDAWLMEAMSDGQIKKELKLEQDSLDQIRYQVIVKLIALGVVQEDGRLTPWNFVIPDSDESVAAKSDDAMSAESKLQKGGIELNPNNFNIESRGEKTTFHLSGNLSQLENLPCSQKATDFSPWMNAFGQDSARGAPPIEGFEPIIFEIVPAMNLPLFLGITKPIPKPVSS